MPRPFTPVYGPGHGPVGSQVSIGIGVGIGVGYPYYGYRPFWGPYWGPGPYWYGSFWYPFAGGGYPYYGYPYYPYYPYGYPYDPVSSSVRLDVKPQAAEVYVDGYRAGTVDDFDGVFQRCACGRASTSHAVSQWLSQEAQRHVCSGVRSEDQSRDGAARAG
jgi:hypothetical protein